MKNFSSWTLETIRDMTSMGWMEERRLDWLPVVASSIKRLVDTQSMIIVTDAHRDWYGKYLLNRLNPSTFERPLLPILCLESLFPHIDDVNSQDKFELLDSMLELFLPNGYFFFYIGKADDSRAKTVQRKDKSMLWLYEKNIENSFYLGVEDDRSDLRLMQLASLFEKSIEAALFCEVDLQGSL